MSKRIILGSSSITILKEVEWNLTDSDYEIMPANDLDDFYGLVKTKNPDLLIIDRDMQEGHGISLCKELKSSDQYARFPVILLVKKTDEESEESIIALEKECKVDRLLTVPLESSKLQSTVQYCFAKQSAASDPFTQNLTPSDKEGPIPAGDAGMPQTQSPFDEIPSNKEPLLSEELTGEELDLGDVTPVSEGEFREDQSPFEEPPISAESSLNGDPSHVSEPEVSKESALNEEPFLSEELAGEELDLGDVTPVSEGGFREDQSPFEEPPMSGGASLNGESSHENEPAFSEEPPLSGAPSHGGEPEISEEAALGEDQKPSEEPVLSEQPEGTEQDLEKASFEGEGERPEDRSPFGELPLNGEPPLSGESSQESEPAFSEEPPLSGAPSHGGEPEISEEAALGEQPTGSEPSPGESTSLRDAGISNKPPHGAMPSLSPEAALAETIKVVEEAVKRSKLIQEKAFHEKTSQKESSKNEIDREEISKREAFHESIQEGFSHLIGFSQDEPTFEKTDRDSEKVETWQKDVSQEQMNKAIEESVPEMTKKLVQEKMNKVIEESVPEMTKKLVQEQVAKIVDDKMLAKMIVDEIDQNRDVVSKLLADAAPNIITKAVERMIPELAEKIIRDEIEQIKQGSGSG